MLNHYLRRGDASIHKRSVTELHLLLEKDELLRMFDAIYLIEECCPKDLRIAFLVAFVLPERSEIRSGFALLYSGHNKKVIYANVVQRR